MNTRNQWSGLECNSCPELSVSGQLHWQKYTPVECFPSWCYRNKTEFICVESGCIFSAIQMHYHLCINKKRTTQPFVCIDDNPGWIGNLKTGGQCLNGVEQRRHGVFELLCIAHIAHDIGESVIRDIVVVSVESSSIFTVDIALCT